MKEFIEANRAVAVGHILTVIQFWVKQGRPKSKKKLPSYEAWSHAVGGLLELMGIKGFLEHKRTNDIDPEAAAWDELAQMSLALANAGEKIEREDLFDHLVSKTAAIFSGKKEFERKGHFDWLMDRLNTRPLTVTIGTKEQTVLLRRDIKNVWFEVVPDKAAAPQGADGEVSNAEG